MSSQAVQARQSEPTSQVNGRMPDFLLIGAAKSASTSLYRYLTRHPGVFMSTPKEPEFFSRDDVFARGFDWYRGLFADARDDQVCGEGSTTYSRWPHTPDVAARIAEVLPDARFIYIMREPVSRTYSHYCHHMRLGITKTFEQALSDDSIYVDCGMYMEQVRRYLRFYPREAFLFLLADDLRDDPDGALRSVQEFLELPATDLVNEEPVRTNRTSSDYFVREQAMGRFRQLPGVSAIADCVPASWREGLFRLIKRSPLGRMLARSYTLPPMEEETRARLKKHFEQPNRELAEFLERDLSHWSA